MTHADSVEQRRKRNSSLLDDSFELCETGARLVARALQKRPQHIADRKKRNERPHLGLEDFGPQEAQGQDQNHGTDRKPPRTEDGSPVTLTNVLPPHEYPQLIVAETLLQVPRPF